MSIDTLYKYISRSRTTLKLLGKNQGSSSQVSKKLDLCAQFSDKLVGVNMSPDVGKVAGMCCLKSQRTVATVLIFRIILLKAKTVIPNTGRRRLKIVASCCSVEIADAVVLTLCSNWLTTSKRHNQ